MSDTTGGRDELSAGLRELRRKAGMSGTTAGNRLGWSQAKISRYENGRMVPPPAEVSALTELYGAPPRLRRRLEHLAALVREETRPPARVVMRRPGRMQRRIGEIEESSRAIRAFVPTIVHGLLQTEAYIRAVFTVAGEFTPDQVEESISARRERQRLLDGSTRTFTIVMSEGALRWQLGGPRVMIEQLEHLDRVSRDNPRVRVGVIPWTTPAPAVPMHGFDIYDQRAVIVGTRAATAFLTEPEDVESHTVMFDALQSAAGFDDRMRATLRRVADDYRSLS